MSPDPMRLVRRRCDVCDWEGIQIEPPDVLHDCPWCHAPTGISIVLQEAVPVVTDAGGKNPWAAALGKLGGPKGGKARAASLSKKRRSEIARKAARARWTRKPKNPTS